MQPVSCCLQTHWVPANVSGPCGVFIGGVWEKERPQPLGLGLPLVIYFPRQTTSSQVRDPLRHGGGEDGDLQAPGAVKRSFLGGFCISCLFFLGGFNCGFKALCVFFLSCFLVFFVSNLHLWPLYCRPLSVFFNAGLFSANPSKGTVGRVWVLYIQSKSPRKGGVVRWDGWGGWKGCFLGWGGRKWGWES